MLQTRHLRNLWPWLRLAAIILPAAVLWLAPLLWFLLYNPSFLTIAIVSATAVLGLLMYTILLLSWSDLTRPLRRFWSNLRYRWATREIDRKMTS